MVRRDRSVLSRLFDTAIGSRTRRAEEIAGTSNGTNTTYLRRCGSSSSAACADSGTNTLLARADAVIE
jgi:hypothetical protein